MWRETGRKITFFGLDGRAMFLLLFVLYAPRWWTLALALCGIGVFMLLQRRGYTVPNAFRRIRILLTGTVKRAVRRSRFKKTRV